MSLEGLEDAVWRKQYSPAMIHQSRKKYALVTGAGSGIGLAIVKELATRDYLTFALGRDIANLTNLESSKAGPAHQIQTRVIDLTHDEEVEALVQLVSEKTDALDVLVHSAGLISTGTMADCQIDDLDRMYRINTRAPYLLTKLCLPLLKKSRGQVVFINSSAGLQARSGAGQYACTKHALKAIADSLRAEVNVDGIRVLSVYPGRTATPMQERLYQASGEMYVPESLLQPMDIATTVAHALQLHRTAEITDIHIRNMEKTSMD